MDKLIAFLVLAVLVSVTCGVLLRFVRLHWSLKAIGNLAITTAVVCAVVMQDGSAPPWNHALLITLFFSVPASLCVVLLSTALKWMINKRRAPAPRLKRVSAVNNTLQASAHRPRAHHRASVLSAPPCGRQTWTKR